MKQSHLLLFLSTFLVTVIFTPFAWAEKTTDITPAAIFTFDERGSGVKGYGSKVSDILFANLVVDPNLFLVDRTEMKKILAEQELNLSGAVNTSQAIQVGQLIGAKILITGSVIEADETIYIVAKIIGSETSRVLGESVKGKSEDQIASLTEALAEQIKKTIVSQSDELVVKEVNSEDRIAQLNKVLGKAKRPTVKVNITERHVGQQTIDPAAETEMIMLCRETGFEVVDASAGSSDKVDIIIEGEGFSEFAIRRGNLVSTKARVEIKAIDTSTGNIIAVDRYTTVAIDLSEQIAGKKALQKAAAIIAQRLLPQLVEK